MLQWILSSSVLILVITALRYLVRGRISLRLQYALWLLVLVRLLIPVSFGESRLSIMNIPARSPAVQTAGILPPAPSSGVPAEALPRESAALPAAVSDTPVSDAAPVRVSASARELLPSIWLAGAAVMAAVFSVTGLRFRSRTKKDRRLWGYADGLPVYVSSGVSTPCMFGLFHPAIYIDPGIESDQTALRHVLAHEQTHFSHGDHLWSLLRCLCLCIHWYNPLVWLAAALSRRDGELACDEGAIKRIGESERAGYGRTLISLSCGRWEGFLCTAATMKLGKRNLKERIELLVKKPRTAAAALAALLLVCSIAAGCTFTGAENTAAAPAPDSGNDTALSDSNDVPEESGQADGYYAEDFDVPQPVLAAAESAARQARYGNAFSGEDGNGIRWSEWRINRLEKVSHYDDFLGFSPDIYCLNYELKPSDTSDDIILSGGMYETEDGWFCPDYPNSRFIIFDSASYTVLATMFCNDASPDSDIFRSDLRRTMAYNTAYSLRFYAGANSIMPLVEEQGSRYWTGGDWRESVGHSDASAAVHEAAVNGTLASIMPELPLSHSLRTELGDFGCQLRYDEDWTVYDEAFNIVGSCSQPGDMLLWSTAAEYYYLSVPATVSVYIPEQDDYELYHFSYSFKLIFARGANADAAAGFEPGNIEGVSSASLGLIGGRSTVTLYGKDALAELEALLQGAVEEEGHDCPHWNYELNVSLESMEGFSLQPAVDGCPFFWAGEKCYRYTGSSGTLWQLFGMDVPR